MLPGSGFEGETFDMSPFVYSSSVCLLAWSCVTFEIMGKGMGDDEQ